MKTIHLMGVGGSAMVALARLFKEAGHAVQGSDLRVYPPASEEIEKLGIRFFEGYKPENLKPMPDLVVVGNVIPRTNPEAQEMIRQEIPYVSMPKALCDFFLRDRTGVMATGTHGKTTTTALMAWILESLDKEPGFFLGGIPQNFGISSRAGGGSHFVVEGDEYDTAFFEKSPKFLHYGIDNVILTSIEFDHADIYSNFEEVKGEFIKLVKRLSEESNLVVCGDFPVVREVASMKKGRSPISYGKDRSNDWILKDFRYTDKGTRYAFEKGKNLLEVAGSPMLGVHNALNHLACIAMVDQLEEDVEKACHAIESFRGARRRQQLIKEKDGVLYYEDFAHHPTAIRETISAFRPLVDHRSGRLIVALEPRSNTLRRKIFQSELAKALSGADYVVLTPVYTKQDSLKPEAQLDTSMLVQDVKHGKALHEYEELLPALEGEVRENDVVVLMSNGDFQGELQKLKEG